QRRAGGGADGDAPARSRDPALWRRRPGSARRGPGRDPEQATLSGSRMTRAATDPFRLAGKLLELLHYGGLPSPPKRAVLLGLLALCVEFTTRGGAPTVIPTKQLAHKVVEIYWPPTWPYKPHPRAGGDVLYQNTGRAHVEVIAKICA